MWGHRLRTALAALGQEPSDSWENGPAARACGVLSGVHRALEARRERRRGRSLTSGRRCSRPAPASRESATTGARRKHAATWSFTTPTACMYAYTIVEPTNLKPRRFKSLLHASESSVRAG